MAHDRYLGGAVRAARPVTDGSSGQDDAGALDDEPLPGQVVDLRGAPSVAGAGTDGPPPGGTGPEASRGDADGRVTVIEVDARRRDGRRERPVGVETAGVDAVRLYLNEIGRVELLSAEAEVDLAKRIAAGRTATVLLRPPEEPPPDGAPSVTSKLTAEQRARLRRVERAGRRSARQLTEANLRLVVSIAKRYLGQGLQFPDLIQEGNIGLMRAVDKFDHRRGYKFSTYATWWIRQMISRSIADQSRTIRIPVHLVETMNRIRRTERSLVQQLGREPTLAEVAVAVSLPASKLEEFRRLAVDPSSLDAPLGEDGDGSVGELIEDGNATAPPDAAARSLLQGQVAGVLADLSERERTVIIRRFGLGEAPPCTLEEVGLELQLTRERIRQIEAKALLKLRVPAGARGLEGYLEG